MIPKECKRFAEVDFPIAEVLKHSAREKSIRHGQPSILHLWWVRRPLAACRTMLLGLLLPFRVFFAVVQNKMRPHTATQPLKPGMEIESHKSY